MAATDSARNASATPPQARLAPPRVTFETLTFSDGSTIELDSKDIVAFVGPNNAGKSAALRELEAFIGQSPTQTVIKTASLRKAGTVDQLRSYLLEFARKVGDDRNLTFQGFRYSIHGPSLEAYWHGNLEPLRPLFCTRIATETRITDSNPQNAIAILDQSPAHPIHMLYADDRLEARMSSYFRRAFGKDLILFHAGGASWPLLVGERPAFESGEDRVSATYNERLRQSTVPLQNQGDGMRSFVSVILHMLAPNTPSVLLLDEPEAFLHPPQARLLGEFLAQERPTHAQLFIATHSPDVLQGLLNVAPEQLRIIRLQREGTLNRARELDKTRTKAISLDPLMKFSSVLSGVFHRRVLICESDADCMFYSMVLDVPEVRGQQQPDVLFLQAAGKHRMASLAEALRALDVDVDVIADIDLLNDESVLERLVQALGGDWLLVQGHARPLKVTIEQHKPWLNANEMVNGIRHVLEQSPNAGEFPRNLRAQIESLFRKASPWDAVKDAGEAAIPPGEASTHFKQLQSLCNAFGLWIVPVGELEGFCKAEGGHGPKWVQRVVEKHDLAADPDLARARAFVRSIWVRTAP